MPGKRLSFEERARIEGHWTAGRSIPEIAEAVGRDRSTVWRGISRHHAYRHGPKDPSGARDRAPGRCGLYRWGYAAGWAQRHAVVAARRHRPARLSMGQPLRAVVLDLLEQRWSPQQIAARLRAAAPDQPEL